MCWAARASSGGGRRDYTYFNLVELPHICVIYHCHYSYRTTYLHISLWMYDDPAHFSVRHEILYNAVSFSNNCLNNYTHKCIKSHCLSPIWLLMLVEKMCNSIYSAKTRQRPISDIEFRSLACKYKMYLVCGVLFAPKKLPCMVELHRRDVGGIF